MRIVLPAFFIVVLILLSFTGSSQDGYPCIPSGIDKKEALITGELLKVASMPDAATDFNTFWLNGDVYSSFGGVIRNRQIKYNCLLDELFLYGPGTNQVIKLDKESVSGFHFYNFKGDTSIYFSRIWISRPGLVDSAEIFARELFKGEISLYVMHSLYFLRSEAVRINNVYIMKDIYKEEPVYIIVLPDGRSFGMKRLIRRKLDDIFPGLENGIRKYLNDSPSGSLKTIPEIVSLIAFLNSVYSDHRH
jgi:hypothetical protein